VVTLLVIPDPTQHADTVVDGVRTLLRGKCLPGQLPAVGRATPNPFSLVVAIRVDGRFEPDDVRRRARSALLDPESGLLSLGSVGIGSPLFHSDLMQTLIGR
jgi:hypothetical protein